MKPEGVPFFGVILAVILAGAWWWRSYDNVTFDAPEELQFMQPQIEKGANRFGQRTARLRPDELQPYDIVRFQVGRAKNKVLTARVIALEGQRVRIEGGKILVDDQPIEDPYVRYKNKNEFYPELIVPAGCVFVLNDLRGRMGADRWDSRNLGPIPFRSIQHRFSSSEAKAYTRRRGG